MGKKVKMVECSLGCQTPECLARKVDELLPTLPKELRTLIRKDTTDTSEVNTSKRTDISWVSTRDIDRDKEIVEPSQIILEDFRLNPVVLFSHDGERPVGKALWIKAVENGLMAKTYYPTRPKKFIGEWFPDYIFALVEAEVLRGKSVGLLALDIRDPSKEEEAEFPGIQRVISRSLLLEYSVVSVPSNPTALVQAINKGITPALNWLKCIGVAQKPKHKAKAIAGKPLNAREPLDARKPLNADKIAEMAIQKILNRWEA